MDHTKTATIEMGPDAIEAIRQLNTSALLGLLADHEALTRTIAERKRAAGQRSVWVEPDDVRVFRDAIAAEIDRRIPVPEPRGETVRVVGVEAGGALLTRGDGWPPTAVDEPDRLGEFLTQYDEYLDGNRSYTDLPPAIRAPTELARDKKDASAEVKTPKK
jgi:hypothetical protein